MGAPQTYNKARSPSRQRPRDRTGSGRRQPSSGRRKGTIILPKGAEIYVLDKLEHGGLDREHHSWSPICQVIRYPNFQFYEVEYNRETDILLQHRYIITQLPTDPFGKVHRKLRFNDLTPTAKDMLEPVLEQIVKNHQERFVEWINKAGPITIRRHYLEELPGVGKKIMQKILEERERQPFNSLENIKERIQGFNPIKAIAQRILMELDESEELKHRLFIKKSSTSQEGHKGTRSRKDSRPRQSSKNRPMRSRTYKRGY